MHPTLLEFGSFQISSYGVGLATAMLLGIFLAKRRAVSEGVPPAVVETLSFWIIVSAIIGARFLYTFVEHSEYYFNNPLKFFSFREGGLSFFGGLFLAVAVSAVFCWKKRVRFWATADILAPSLALGLAIAKLGCFMVGCCHGARCDVPWGVIYTDPTSLANPKGVPLHPVQLYESLMSGSIFFFLLYFRTHRRFFGEVFLAFAILYGILRSVLELFRGAPGHLGTLTTAQFLSIPMVGLTLFWWFWNRTRMRE